MSAPNIETERLILRMPNASDVALHTETLTDPERSKFIGGPYPPEEAQEELADLAADWDKSGLGGWAVEIKETGKFAGVVAINNPADFPEIELGWTFHKSAEGKGYAYEAILPMRRYAFQTVGLKTAVSYIDPDNTRSLNLVKRLGATLDKDAQTPNNDPCLVYRHSKKEALN